MEEGVAEEEAEEEEAAAEEAAAAAAAAAEAASKRARSSDISERRLVLDWPRRAPTAGTASSTWCEGLVGLGVGGGGWG